MGSSNASGSGGQQDMDPEDDLRWVRSQIEALIFSRSTGGAYTDRDRASYRDLCAREAALMFLIPAA
ncbi:MAG TPA: hypothetical protein DCQ30_01605 [Acidimicrobiaceae bacterium]|nr:hypothetical protein [Acidimicrobiaceae bacterium]